MSIQSHYSINVAKVLSTDQFGSRYTHLFQTAPGSIVTKNKAWDMLELLKVKFPADGGYKVTMTYWKCDGHSCD